MGDAADEFDDFQAAHELTLGVGEHLAVLAADQGGEFVGVALDRSVSSPLASGTLAVTAPVAGSNTSPQRPLRPGTLAPSMKWARTLAGRSASSVELIYQSFSAAAAEHPSARQEVIVQDT